MIDSTPSNGPIPGQVRHARAKADRQPTFSDTLNKFLAAGSRFEAAQVRDRARIAHEDAIRGDARVRPLAILGPGGEYTREVRP